MLGGFSHVRTAYVISVFVTCVGVGVQNDVPVTIFWAYLTNMYNM